MADHFLSEFVAGIQREEPTPWFNPDGDCIVYQVADEAVVADRIDDVLTIYRSAIDDRAIGYQIKGVQALTSHFGWRGMTVQSAEAAGELCEVSIYALLLAAYEKGPKTIHRRRAYANAFESISEAPRISGKQLSLLSA